ncbi:MAG TPA: AMP-dependent synthetase [Gemmatimonadetes bacterium]|nr:AMP-dependent synthetase [Gemmatimonadota bacterium]
MSEAQTIRALLDVGEPSAPAIGAPRREFLNYAGLCEHVDRTVASLNQLGLGRGDRVAIVLPNGPEMASAFVSIAAGTTTAPLNPGYRRAEYDFYLEDLAAKALIVEAGSESDSVESARSLGIPVLTLRVPEGARAGEFEIEADPDVELEPTTSPGPTQPDDVALVLHTSGTTSRPKIVPLLHRNVCASAKNIRATLSLTPEDRCLNVMPLFHIHGLMAPVLSSLSSGASVSCTPGFNALKFFSWLDKVEPTWYSAVPTMHQTLLARAGRNEESVARAQLRFIRSSSAALPPQVLAELEETFGVTVVEAYAMTEAAHQMTCNQLPPGVRKPGSVGPAAGPEVSIMDDEGNLLEPGNVGEIVIRGPNVTPGYENNPDANATAFTNGWFRTGDQGVMDDDRFVTLTGRLKEIINRGGEKISPKEVDEVLMDHPAIQQVCTFAVPHDKLGEEVAAAVVLREGAEATTGDIRRFASERLANFKVPHTVVVLDEIPKGPTGKLRRIGLAEQLGIT